MGTAPPPAPLPYAPHTPTQLCTSGPASSLPGPPRHPALLLLPPSLLEALGLGAGAGPTFPPSEARMDLLSSQTSPSPQGAPFLQPQGRGPPSEPSDPTGQAGEVHTPPRREPPPSCLGQLTLTPGQAQG